MRSFPLGNLRAQTGLIFFAGLLSLVVITFAISAIVGNMIREDDARLAALASSSEPGGSDDAVAETGAIRQRRDGNVGMVRGMYGALFLSSLVFLLIGLWFIQQIIVSPIEALDQMARRIAAGDLETPMTKMCNALYNAGSRRGDQTLLSSGSSTIFVPASAPFTEQVVRLCPVAVGATCSSAPKEAPID